MERVELFAPSALGTCWYGKYHYLEPWIGCDHACPYCYARCRGAVTNSLTALKGQFAQPTLQMPRSQLLQAIEEKVNSGEIRVLKLCRYTDIFTPSCVANGLSRQIIEILSASKLERVIITTKGVPDKATLEIMASHPKVFSYSAAVHPAGIALDSPIKGFDTNLLDVSARLDAAEFLHKRGLLTTIHLDPFVATIDDDSEVLYPFLEELKKRELKRVMWSYLLLSEGIIDPVKRALSTEMWQRLQENYDLLGARQILPANRDTIAYSTKEAIFLASVDKLYNALTEGGFEFVICSLKNVETLRNLKKYPKKMFCDGKFYA